MKIANHHVTAALAPLTIEVANLTKIPVAVNPEKTVIGIRQLADVAHLNCQQAVSAEDARQQGRITELTREFTTVRVADLPTYKTGAESACGQIDASTVNKNPSDVALHVHRQVAVAKAILAAVPALRTEALMALFVACFLVAIAALGVTQPLMTKAMGANGDPATLGMMVWMVIVSSAVALTLGAVNVCFFRPTEARLSAWNAIFVGLAIIFIAGRYVASAVSADFMLMQDLPSSVQVAVHLAEALGIAAALLCIEVGAGRCLAFFWLRFQQTRNDPPRLQELIRETQEWSQLRVLLDTRSRQATAMPSAADCFSQAVMQVVQTVDEGLQAHLDTLARFHGAISQPWAGSALEHVDIAWLEAQVQACLTARGELLRLAGFAPPPSTTTFAAPNWPQPPAPLSATFVTP